MYRIIKNNDKDTPPVHTILIIGGADMIKNYIVNQYLVIQGRSL